MFLKFIKQYLNAAQLVSRTLSGIKVMIYITMVAATMLLAYQELNKLKSYKIAKLKFETKPGADIIKTIAALCGGATNKTSHLFFSG